MNNLPLARPDTIREAKRACARESGIFCSQYQTIKRALADALEQQDAKQDEKVATRRQSRNKAFKERTTQ